MRKIKNLLILVSIQSVITEKLHSYNYCTIHGGHLGFMKSNHVKVDIQNRLHELILGFNFRFIIHMGFQFQVHNSYGSSLLQALP